MRIGNQVQRLKNGCIPYTTHSSFIQSPVDCEKYNNEYGMNYYELPPFDHWNGCNYLV